jgi:hypothetical protein
MVMTGVEDVNRVVGCLFASAGWFIRRLLLSYTVHESM